MNTEPPSLEVSLETPSRSRIPTLWQLRRWLGYGIAALLIFVVFAWVNLPTRSIAWRISHEAKERGFLVSVGDVSVSPFGSVSLYDMTWAFAATHAGQVVAPIVIDELTVGVSLLGLLAGNYEVSVRGELDEGTVEVAWTRDDVGTSVHVIAEALPLYSVPTVQQSLNAPVQGTLDVNVELQLSEHRFDRARGTIILNCNECSLGDGEALVYIPGSRGLLARGITLPELQFGTISAQLDVIDGVVKVEAFEAKSDDLAIQIDGEVKFKEPVKKSRLDLAFKVFISDDLQNRHDNIRLLVGTSHKSTKMGPPHEGWLGYRLRGPLSRPRFTGIGAKSRELRIREARERRRKRREERERERDKRDAKQAVPEKVAEVPPQPSTPSAEERTRESAATEQPLPETTEQPLPETDKPRQETGNAERDDQDPAVLKLNEAALNADASAKDDE